MANLNFQQPPRSIANTSLSGRNTSGFGSSSLSGHVTPTSGMFPPGGPNFVPAQPPQLSPNRSAQLSVGGPSFAGGSRGNNIFSGFKNLNTNDRRQGMVGLTGGTMVSFLIISLNSNLALNNLFCCFFSRCRLLIFFLVPAVGNLENIFFMFFMLRFT